ncbi:hypothetical protein [Sphingomonas sp. SUN039]|uniref:hypothetical protein n=1 Tax=Sphingomonas sp. SUN039 TaxID=2937787 RepID=UPI0021645F76|nr:hypothetical protein [Sphingomonas sp. SUN039]UVO55288.1 hypothetical protein M0209_14575 [Sphingomonas sp. SUN039]
MGRTIMLSAAVCALAIASTPARAASDYVQCDGQAKGMDFAEGLARFTVILGSLGLFGSPEQDNAAERRFGQEGVDACTRAVDDGRGKGNDLRRSRLLLARAIHHVEAKNLDAALADVRQFPAIGGEKAADPLFLRSFALSALELEAAVLLRQGKTAEAEAVALKMAAASPYDLANLVRVTGYLDKSLPVSAAKRAYFANVIRLMPELRLSWADALRWQGDYGAAGDEAGAVVAMLADKDASAQLIAGQALDLYMAGRAGEADALAARARSDNDTRAASETTDAAKAVITRTDDLLAFARIVVAMKAGQTAEARRMFAARERWLSVPVPTVADVAARLRVGAAPAELTGALARDPAALRSEALSGELTRRTNEAALKAMYRTIRPYLSPGNYSALSKNVNETAKSKYMPVKQDTLPGETVTVTGGIGVAGGEAVLLHSALIARARGKTAFAIVPFRSSLSTARVLFENPGTSKLPSSAYFAADAVVAALGPRFVPPPSK